MQPATTVQDFDSWLGEIAGGATAGFVARETATGAFVGAVTLSQIFHKNFQNAYVSYHGTAATAGRGLMSEAVWRVAQFAFTKLGLHRLEANIQPGDARSIALARRVGFRHEGFSPRYLRIGGIWRDHERWALLADDLNPTRFDPSAASPIP